MFVKLGVENDRRREVVAVVPERGPAVAGARRANAERAGPNGVRRKAGTPRGSRIITTNMNEIH